MDNSALLTLLSVVISAIITSTGTVIAAYISKDKGKKANPPIETILRLPGHDSSSLKLETKKFWNKRSIVIVILVLIIVAVAARWLLGKFTSERLEFVSINDPTALNPNLQWDAGSSEFSTYALDGDTLIMIAGPHTWPNFPMISYMRPLTGNVSVQVKVVFVPEAQVITTAQMVGILVHPINARLVQSDTSFPQDWVAVSKSVTDAGVLVGCRGSWEDYSSDTVFLKIERRADSWRCAYSSNGENWIWLNAKVDDTQLQNKQLAISLFAYSITDKAITVKFSDWVIFNDGK